MFNSFSGVGRLSADPESRFTQTGTQVATFTVCCDSGYGDKKHTEFVKAVAWDKVAKVACDYLRKGSMCLIQGEMKTRIWDDKDGVKRYTTEIIVRDLRLLSPKQNQPPNSDQYQAPEMGDSTPF